MSSESQKLYIIFPIDTKILDLADEVSYGFVLPIHDHSQKCGITILNISSKGW